GYSEMLQEEAEETGQSALLPDLRKIHSAGKQLLSLINDILDLSKIEAGKMDLFFESVDVNTLISEVKTTIHPLIEKKGNTLIVDAPDRLGTMKTDGTRMRQILLNLLSNASKFTDHGVISLRVSREVSETKWFVFRVSDSGIGMSSEQLGRLFQA